MDEQMKQCISCGKPFGHIAYTPESYCDACDTEKEVRSLLYRSKKLQHQLARAVELLQADNKDLASWHIAKDELIKEIENSNPKDDI